MAIGDLLWRPDPDGKMGNIVIVGKEGKAGDACSLQAQQECAGLSHGESVGLAPARARIRVR